LPWDDPGGGIKPVRQGLLNSEIRNSDIAPSGFPEFQIQLKRGNAGS
jgi:hypothetical protein